MMSAPHDFTRDSPGRLFVNDSPLCPVSASPSLAFPLFHICLSFWLFCRHPLSVRSARRTIHRATAAAVYCSLYADVTSNRWIISTAFQDLVTWRVDHRAIDWTEWFTLPARSSALISRSLDPSSVHTPRRGVSDFIFLLNPQTESQHIELGRSCRTFKENRISFFAKYKIQAVQCRQWFVLKFRIGESLISSYNNKVHLFQH